MADEQKEKFTPGPWGWFGNANSGQSPEIYLATKHSGRRYVMGFKRWGFYGAQPRFRMNHILKPASELLKFEVGNKSVTGAEEAKKDDTVYRYDIRGIDAPDAHLIAAAPCLYDALKSIVEDDDGCSTIAPELLDKARSVLAKARGE